MIGFEKSIGGFLSEVNANPTASENDHADDRGSLWRRWDPHVHLPGTLHNDQFGAAPIEDALDVLAGRRPAIEVIGVTDYFTTRSFRRARAAWDAGHGAGIRYLFPNVEIRLSHFTNSGGPLNLHLMSSASDVDLLDQFLGSLEFEYQGRPFRADDAGLIDLGRTFSENSALDEESALKEGAAQFKVSFENLRTKFRNHDRARDRLIIGVAGGSNDGTSGIRDEEGGSVALRQGIESLANVIFSGSPQQSKFWSGEGVDDRERLERIYGGLKLCLHGSDAHTMDALGQPALERFCWLKGNATFETLRLACLAPDSRSHIDHTPPSDIDSYGRITSLSLQNAPWFIPDSLPINPGLVAIIGPRGSGKTALADLIAAGSGSEQPFENPKSFVHRAGTLLDGATVTVQWSHGETTSGEFPSSDAADSAIRGVRYLSQQFVERLCASDGISTSLISEIERVVFNAWPIEDRQGATDFTELLDLRLRDPRVRQRTELNSITEISEAITEQRSLQVASPGKKIDLAKKQGEIEIVTNQIKELTSASSEIDSNRLSEVNRILDFRRSEVQKIDRRITELNGLVGEVETARTSTFPNYVSRLKSAYSNASLKDQDWESFRVNYSGNPDELLPAYSENCKADRIAHVGDVVPDGLTPLSETSFQDLRMKPLNQLVNERERIQGLIGLDRQRTKLLATYNNRAATLNSLIARLEVELTLAANAEQVIEDLTAARLERYASYFDALLAEKQELEALYGPLDVILSDLGESIAKLKFSVRRTVDITQWADKGESLLDLRANGPFRGVGSLATIARDTLLEAWESGDGRAAAESIRKFSLAYSAKIRAQALIRPDTPEAVRDWEKQVSQWIYSASHVTLSYNLSYDGLSIERLSPGSKGIVLLLLYLAIDQEETDPLIIDQPEENLDPMSVYSELVQLFRTASMRRQIIMVTHNANLVVNTDVDQVIVAHCGELREGRLPDFSYTLGGLENAAIRREVCNVLEGGEAAFAQRAKRLQMNLNA